MRMGGDPLNSEYNAAVLNLLVGIQKFRAYSTDPGFERVKSKTPQPERVKHNSIVVDKGQELPVRHRDCMVIEARIVERPRIAQDSNVFGVHHLTKVVVRLAVSR